MTYPSRKVAKDAVYAEVTAPRGGKEEHEWVPVKRFRKYVFSTSKNGCLIHRVMDAKLRWWDHTWHYMLRRQHPYIIAHSYCGLSFRIDSTKAKTCDIPAPDAVLCAACHGEGRNFPRGKEHKISKELAKIHKGCMERGEL
jgi:hypothetical protein